MSKFYGQLQGKAKYRATRCGTGVSRIRASVQSFDGSIITELFYEGKDLCIRVEHSDDSGFYGFCIFEGTVERFLKMCDREHKAERKRRAKEAAIA